MNWCPKTRETPTTPPGCSPCWKAAGPIPDPSRADGRLASATWSPNHSLTPRKLRGLVRKLNYFGGVAISEDAVEFDGDKVEWADIEEIRTRSLIEYMFTGGMDSQIDKLPVPWFPFRRKVIGAISRRR